MARKTKLPVGSPVFWPLESAPNELMAYVTSRLVGPVEVTDGDDTVPSEPTWFTLSFDASWSFVLAQASAQ